MYYLGLDIGSLSCDAVIVDDDATTIATAVVPTGARNAEAIDRARVQALELASIDGSDIAATVSTGYGRRRVEGRIAAVTEISCHGKGIQSLMPGTGVLIDIGGQDSKAIRFTDDGSVADFAMNDKCAAGTGRFLEAMARALQVDIKTLSTLDEGATGGLALSSMCTVFAESEVVSLIADGTEVPEIVAGLNRAVANRVRAMVKRVAPSLGDQSIAMSGGVAYNAGVVRALSSALDHEITIPEKPDTVGALGAALVARERSTS